MARLLLAILALVAPTAWARRARDTKYHFMQLTDVHIEPFYNPDMGHMHGAVCRVPEAFNKSQCVPFRVEPEADVYPFGRLNCDPPMALLRSIMESMTRVAKHAKPDFVIFTGDVPSHQLACQYHQARTIQMVVDYLSEELKDVAPKWYPAMGNNDYFPNYNISLTPNNTWQRYVASLYGRRGVLAGPQLETFALGGFYADVPRKGLRLVVLNTVVWSRKILDWEGSTKKHVHHDDAITKGEGAYTGPDAPLPGVDDSDWVWDEDVPDTKIFIPCEDRPRDPYDQVAWMRKQLQEARASGERVIIAGHVPPGNKAGDNNFCPSHQWDLEDITQEFADIIEVQLYGDHSNDEFRMIWNADVEKPKAVSSVLVSAGVTPRKHCNPSWRLFHVSADHQVHDFTQFYLPLTETDIKWNMKKAWRKLHREGRDEIVSWRFWKKQYSFHEQYGVGLDPDELEELWLRMQRSPRLIEAYLYNMFSMTVGTNDYYDYICDMRYMGEEQNALCAARGRLLEADEARIPSEEARDKAGLRLSAELPLPSDEEAELRLVAELPLPANEATAAASDAGYVQVHPAALVALVATCGVLLTSTALLAWRSVSLSQRLGVRNAAGYVTLA